MKKQPVIKSVKIQPFMYWKHLKSSTNLKERMSLKRFDSGKDTITGEIYCNLMTVNNNYKGKGYIDEFSSSSCNINVESMRNGISVTQMQQLC